MKDVTATIFGILVWGAIIAGFIFIPSYCSRNQTAKKDTAVKDELAEFCNANSAAPAFKGLPDDEHLLTIDLQRSLFVKGKRIAFKGQISDLYRSEKLGALVAHFELSEGSSEIGIYLRCTESQLQQLHDDYQKDKDASFIVVAEFDDVEPDVFVNGKGVRMPISTNENAYSVIGTLVSYRKSAFRKPAAQGSDNDD